MGRLGVGLWIDDLRADLAYAVRTLRRTPAFAVAAIVSLSLGIGANTLVFSVVNALVLRPLPVVDPNRVAFVENEARGYVSQSFPNYLDLRDRTTTFDGLVGYRITMMDVEARRRVTHAWGYLATGNYFDVLGIVPAAGRFFHASEDVAPGASPYVVLSYDYWRSQFGGDPALIGSTIRVNRLPFTVLGVAPEGFHGTEMFYRPALWVPMMMEPQIEVGNPWLDVRATFNTWIVGRLKAGVSPEAAQSNLNAVAAQLARDYPTVNDGMRLKLTRPGLVGDAIGGPARLFAVGILLLAALVLVAACANLASTLAARGADRERELAIRLSIGAGRARIVRQLLTETLVLAAAGGALGCVIAVVAARALSAWQLPVQLPIQFDVRADLRVFLFAFAVTAIAGVLFGLMPARHAARTDPNAALKSIDGVRTGRAWPFRDVLVTVQVALCFLLVAACVISLRGLQRALVMPIGLDAKSVAIAQFDLGLAGYSQAAGEQFDRRVLDAVSRLPGVMSAAYGNSLPLSIDQSSTIVFPETGEPVRESEAARTIRYRVSPGYFRTLGIDLLQGRDIDWHDQKDTPRVAVINETFARTVLHASSPVGLRFRYGHQAQLIQVVGLVADGKYQTLTEGPTAAVFEAIMQSYSTTIALLARSSLSPDQMIGEMRAAIAGLDPELPLFGEQSVERMLGLALFPMRAAATALGVFGLLALVLAATGIHGLVAYAVSRRRREIGIRRAIGASGSSVLRLIFVRVAALLGIGAAAGLALTAIAAPLLANIVYQVAPRDPLTLAVVAAILVGVGLASCWLPARRSLRIEPTLALRSE